MYENNKIFIFIKMLINLTKVVHKYNPCTVENDAEL